MYLLSTNLTPPPTFAVFVSNDALSCKELCRSFMQNVKKTESPWAKKAKTQTVQGEL